MSAWTYLTGGTTARDRIRDATGDNDPTLNVPAGSGNAGPLQVSDDIIAAFLLVTGSGTDEDFAAKQVMELLLAKFARQADSGLAGAGLAANARYMRLKDHDDQLRYNMQRTAQMSAPAVFQANVDSYRQDATRPVLLAWIGMLDADQTLFGTPDDGPWSRFYW